MPWGRARREKKQRSAAQQSLMLDGSKLPVGYVSLDKDGRVLDVNPKWYEILAYSRDEVRGRWFGDFVAPESQAAFQERFTELPNRGEVLNVELSMVRKDGRSVRVLFSGTVERDPSGQIKRIHSLLHDAPGVASPQQVLEHGEERFREVFDHMSSCVAVYEARSAGEDFVLVDFNRAAERAEAVRREDVLGKSVLKVFPGVRGFGLFEVFQRVWRTGNPEHHPLTEYRDERIRGWKENYVYKLPSEEIVAIYDDITERKQAEEALHESEDRYRSLVENIPEIVFTMDLEGRITFLSRRAKAVLGYESAEVIDRSILDFIPEEGRQGAMESMQRGMAGEEIKGFQTPLIAKSGGRLLFECSFTRIRKGGRVIGVQGTAVDITERRRAEHEIEALARFPAENPNPVLRVGASGEIIYANPASESLLRCTVGGALPPDWHRALLTAVRDRAHATADLGCEGRVYSVRFAPIAASGYVNVYARDVTERRQAEEALREREQEIAGIIGSSRDLIWSVDIEGRYVYSNPAAAEIVGYQPEELVGHSSLELLHPQDRKDVEGQLPELIREKRGWQDLVLRWRHKDGTYRWLESNGVPVLDAAGGLIGFRGVDRDITERRQAEEAVRESEKRYRVLVEASPDAISQVDLDGRIVSANQEMARIHGYTDAHDLIGRNALDLFVPEDRLAARDNMEQAVASGGTRDVEHTCLRADGTRFPAELNASVVLDSNGRPTGLIAVIRDVTERKRAQDALAESELKYREVVENASEAICVLQGGRLVFVNPATSVLTGFSSEELLANPFISFVHPDDRDMVLERYRARARGEEPPSVYVFRIFRGDGTARWAEVRAVRINWQGEPGTLNLLSDVTRHVEAEEGLKRSREATIRSMGALTERRDPYTAGHQERVTALACAIGEKMELPSETIDGLRIAALLHDIGKMSIPAELLSKPTRLTETEFSLIRQHPQIAYEVMEGMEFLAPVAEIVLQHHERLDGSGYPRKLKGDEILLEARILNVADVVEAMASHRPYRPALGIDAALQEINEHQGKLYDSSVVEACVQLFADGFEFAPVGASPAS